MKQSRARWGREPFRMPLQRKNWERAVSDCLYDAVGCPLYGIQSCAEAVDGLMMGAVDDALFPTDCAQRQR